MISEVITVTTTPTSIAQLVATARSKTLGDQCKGVRGDLHLHYPVATSTTIDVYDANTVSPAHLLHGTAESINVSQIRDVDITEMKLAVSASTVDVRVIFSKGAIA
jgi:hypothetical protein